MPAPYQNTAQYTIMRVLTINKIGRNVEGMLRGGGKVMVPVRDSGSAFRWPRLDEIWTIRRNGVDWELCGHVRQQFDTTLQDIDDNEVRLDADKVTRADGKELITADALNPLIVPIVDALPATGVPGQILFNSTTNRYYGWNPGTSTWNAF